MKKEWKKIASDFDSPFLRNYYTNKAFYIQKELFGFPYVVFGLYTKDGAVNYFYKPESWIAAHKAIREKIEADYNYLPEIIDKTEKMGDELNQWTEDNIFNKDLAKLKDVELGELLEDAYEKQTILHAYGLILPLMDFQQFSFVEGNLDKILEKYCTKEELPVYFEAFTAPVRNSYAQDQEEDLLKLVSKFIDNKSWCKGVLDGDLKNIEEKYKDFSDLLEEHTKKYEWIYYVYAGPAFSKEQFFGFVKDIVESGENPEDKLEDIEERKKVLAKLRKEFLEQKKPDDFEKAILQMAGKMVWAKPRRKDKQAKTFFHIEKLEREIGKRLHLTLAQVRSTIIKDTKAALGGKHLDIDEVNQRLKDNTCYMNEDEEIIVLQGKEAEQYYLDNVDVSEEDEELNVDQLKGATACKGKVIGAVCIVNSAADMDKMKNGNVLVSMATTPAIVAAMKKAAAIVTDEGGLTCHASIVSRELNTPCLIGTKVATKVFKDGDKVEVDATNGVIKKL